MQRPTRSLLLAPLAGALAACSAGAPSASLPPASATAARSVAAALLERAPRASAGESFASSPPDAPSLDDPARCEDAPELDLAVPTPPRWLAASASPGARPSGRDPLDSLTIRSVVRRHLDGFMGCYQLGLGRDPNLEGRVTTRFAIDTAGRIAKLSIAANELPDCSVVECIRAHFATIEFPPPGNVVTVQYPLVFGHAD